MPCKQCNGLDHHRTSSKKCLFYEPPHKKRHIVKEPEPTLAEVAAGTAEPVAETKDTTWTLQIGLEELIPNETLRKRIQKDVVECSDLAVETWHYVFDYHMDMLHCGKPWPDKLLLLPFYYHLKAGKLYHKLRQQPDVMNRRYLRKRDPTWRWHDAVYRSTIIEQLAVQHETAWKNCITVQLCKHIVDYCLRAFPHREVKNWSVLSKYAWTCRINYELLSSAHSAMSEEVYQLTTSQPTWFTPQVVAWLRDYKGNWWHLVPFAFNLGRWFSQNEIRSFAVVPVMKPGLKHIRYITDGLWDLLGATNLRPHGVNKTTFTAKAPLYWWQHLTLDKNPQHRPPQSRNNENSAA